MKNILPFILLLVCITTSCHKENDLYPEKTIRKYMKDTEKEFADILSNMRETSTITPDSAISWVSLEFQDIKENLIKRTRELFDKHYDQDLCFETRNINYLNQGGWAESVSKNMTDIGEVMEKHGITKDSAIVHIIMHDPTESEMIKKNVEIAIHEL